MASLPAYAKFKLAGTTLTPGKVSERAEMERGVPRTRRVNSDALHTLAGAIVLNSKAEMEAFEDWYYARDGGNGGQAWVDWFDECSSGPPKLIRIVELGTLTSLRGDYDLSEWQVTIEWIRSTY